MGSWMEAHRLAQVSALDIPGGGQVVVDGTTAYVGHTTGPEATTIINVADPAHPRVIKQLQCQHAGVHAHKVRVKDGLMLTNYESKAYAGEAEEGFVGGLHIWDVENPADPRLITFWPCAKSGVHRFTFDGRYAYLSPEMEGYVGNIVLILDLADPANPKEVGALACAGAVDRGGRDADVGGDGDTLSSSDPQGRPALCQLLVRRVVHPEHRGHVQPRLRGRSRSA